MLPFSHFFAGYAAGALLVSFGVIEVSTASLVFLGLFSLVPDIDVFWLRELREHHSSVLHTPAFWAVTSLFIGIFEPGLALAVLTLSLVHILTDAVTGRSGGIVLLYPFADREFRVCRTLNETGSLDPVRPDLDVLKEHMRYYLEDKRLVMFEVAVNMVGVLGLFHLLTNF